MKLIRKQLIAGSRDTWTVIQVGLILPGEDAVAAVDAAGRLGLLIAPTRTIGSCGLWGCATCEQLHPTTVERCPLLGGATKQAVIGPYEIDGEDTSFAGAEREALSAALGTEEEGRDG